MAKLNLLRFFAWLALLFAPLSHALVLPHEPVMGERLLVAVSLCDEPEPQLLAPPRLSMQGGALELRAELRSNEGYGGFGVQRCIRLVKLSDPLVAGNYDVIFAKEISGGRAGISTESDRLTSLSVRDLGAPATPQYRRLNGNWFDPAAPGTGVNLVQGRSGALLAAWLTHPPPDLDPWSSMLPPASGPNTFGGWYVMSEGRWVSPTVFRGPLFITYGPPSDRPWDGSMLSAQPAGFAQFTFVGPEEMRFEATVMNGHLNRNQGTVSVTQTLRRFRF
ncbi:MAG TPA: hypothetical protein VEC19_09410 [Usitatibacter sp.]|nr:hypothetical protein [Usitatibacter sp.]